MAWKTNIYDIGSEYIKYKARLYILDTILKSTPFLTNDSDTDYVFEGDIINLGETSDIFYLNNKINILLNGVELDKNTEITWINNYSFSMNIAVDKDDVITIYG